MGKTGVVCAIAECHNTSSLRNDLSFHRFPTDKSIRKQWIAKCRRKDNWNPSTSRICSEHFDAEDFERDLKAELLGLVPTRRLKVGTIPSLNLSKQKCSKITSDAVKSRKNRFSEKARKQKHDDIIKSLLTDNSEESPLAHASQSIDLQPDFKVLYEQMRLENERLQTEITGLKLELNENFSKAKKAIQLSEALEQVFTPNEIMLMTGDKKRVNWTAEEISKAFALRYQSKRAYIYLRNQLNYPFPGISTLKRWAGNIDLRHGILNDVLRVMAIVSKDHKPIDRLCVLSFGEMKVKETFEYDEQTDEIVGTYNYMQVVVVCGLCSKWKQPIYVDFDQKMTKSILLEIIERLDKIGYNVVSCTSDCGGGNDGLWSQLDISVEKPYFLHPVTSSTVVYMPDAPHLLKLLRNWFLSSGFLLKDGTTITKVPVQELLKLTGREEVTSCHKLKEIHLTCEETQRQNVTLAAQLFSNSVGTALIHYLPGDDRRLAKNTGNFLLLINRWFNLMNVYTPKITVPHKTAYGLQLEEQNELLQEVYTVISGMQCLGKKSLQLFQKGIMMCCIGLPILLANVKKQGASYIMTHRLNQDILENLFSHLRFKGSMNDPSPLDALYRLRLIILGKTPGVVQSNQNVQNITDEAEGEFLFTSTLRRAAIEPAIV